MICIITLILIWSIKYEKGSLKCSIYNTKYKIFCFLSKIRIDSKL